MESIILNMPLSRQGHGNARGIAETCDFCYPVRTMKSILFLLFASVAVHAAPLQAVPTGNLRLFLLIGQSNMAGRGRNYETDNADNPRILKLDGDGNWVSGIEPVHFDKRAAGACLATSFAREYIKDNPDETVGLIPCAVGGTGIDRWVPGGDLFKKAVSRAHRAEKDGQIIGILWHQGEHDASRKERADTYERKLESVVDGFRRELGSEVPFIAGGLGEYLPDHRSRKGEPDIPFSREVREATRRVMDRMPRCGFASSTGITETIGDTLHFSTPSLRAFGLRYYAAWKEIANMLIGKYASRDYALLVDGKPVEVVATPKREHWEKAGKGLHVCADGNYSSPLSHLRPKRRSR